MSNTNEIYAKNLMKRADARMKPSLMRWKPNYDEAIELYEDAARAYRASNNFKMACEAEEKSADANVRLDNYWHAGKALERATELLTKCEPLDGGAVLQMAERANDAYVMANRTQVGAESLSRAARLLETSDTKMSAALLMLCVENLQEDGKDVYASDHHKQLGATLVRAERYQDAAEACVKYGASCARAGQMNSLAKAYLSAIIALLYDGDGVGAQATFNDVHELPGFDKSEERETAYRLLTAYRAADADKIKYAIEDSSCARFLDIVFSRLARKLPNPKHELGAVATKMGADLPTGDTTDEDAGDDLT